MSQLGDDGVLFEVPGGPVAARRLARSILAREVVPAAGSVGVFGPYETLSTAPEPPPPREHRLEVVLDGPDIAETGLSGPELGRLLASAILRVDYLGFMPGFAYMSGLPSPLAGLDRRPVPRTRVEAGSLAVAGGYAAIYPSTSPGGWHLLGRTDRRLFDPEAAPYALLQPGDSVSLVPVGFLPHLEPPARLSLSGGDLEVLEPGPLLLLEDLGREGVGAYGVPRAGAFNCCWAEIINRAVGNESDAAVLESAGSFCLRATRELLVAVAGAELRLDGTTRPTGMVTSVAPGQLLDLGPPARARSYLAVSGGLEGPRHFDSFSFDVSSGLWPGPLRKGDSIAVGRQRGRPRLRFELPIPKSPVVLRVIEGPDGSATELLSRDFRVDPLSNRAGLRLQGDEVSSPLAVASHAVTPGSIQLPPGGQPIVLGPDAGRVGGYPVVAVVITADLWRLGCLRPGDEVAFKAVSLEEGRAARDELTEGLRACVSGYFPTAFA
jgi:biotin-dependent carboxylase-like uncharacterized protein